MKATISNYRQSPRKVRLVANLIKGKKVEEASIELSMLSKRASLFFSKLLNSAISNAKENNKLSKEDLVVSEVTVDTGVTLKRRMPRARGMAFPIKKRTSNVSLFLSEITK